MHPTFITHTKNELKNFKRGVRRNCHGTNNDQTIWWNTQRQEQQECTLSIFQKKKKIVSQIIFHVKLFLSMVRKIKRVVKQNYNSTKIKICIIQLEDQELNSNLPLECMFFLHGLGFCVKPKNWNVWFLFLFFPRICEVTI